MLSEAIWSRWEWDKELPFQLCFFLVVVLGIWILAGWNCTICQILTRLDRRRCFDQLVPKVVNIWRVLVTQCSVPLTAVNICEFEVRFYIVFPATYGFFFYVERYAAKTPSFQLKRLNMALLIGFETFPFYLIFCFSSLLFNELYSSLFIQGI